jgi:hypothetical protein
MMLWQASRSGRTELIFKFQKQHLRKHSARLWQTTYQDLIRYELIKEEVEHKEKREKLKKIYSLAQDLNLLDVTYIVEPMIRESIDNPCESDFYDSWAEFNAYYTPLCDTSTITVRNTAT